MLELLFSFRGRIGRASFWRGYLSVGLTPIAVAAAGIGLFAVLRPADWARITAGGQAPGTEMLMLMLAAGSVFIVILLWSMLALMAKRLHDLGLSGLIGIPLLIVLPLAIAALGTWPGRSMPNAFGPPEPSE